VKAGFAAKLQELLLFIKRQNRQESLRKREVGIIEMEKEN